MQRSAIQGSSRFAHRTVAVTLLWCGLWPMGVLASPNAPAPLWEGAAWVVAAKDAPTLALQARAVLRWVGLAYPTLSPQALGTLGAQAGFRVLDAHAWEDAGVPAHAAVALVEWEAHPGSTSLAVWGFGREGCEVFQQKTQSSPDAHTAVWWKRGVCWAVNPGSCVRPPCAPLQAAPFPPKGNLQDAIIPPKQGVGLSMTGETVRRALGTRAGRELRELRHLLLRVDASAQPWKVDLEVVTAPPKGLPGRSRQGAQAWLPLPNPLWEATEAPLWVAMKPSPDANLRPSKNVLREHGLQEWSGVNVPAALKASLTGATLGLEWWGFETVMANKGAQEESQPYGAFHAQLDTPAQAAQCLRALEDALTARGFTADPPLWIQGSQTARLESTPQRCSVWTGKAAHRVHLMESMPLDALPFAPRVHVRAHGRRLKAALGSANLLRGDEDFVGLHQALGPMLERLNGVSFFGAPNTQGMGWRWTGSLEVDLP